MNEFLLVLTGAAISLVSSVTVTWLQARHLRRGELRVAARDSTRQLTGLFIAERDLQGGGPSPALAEAEMMAVAIADRRTRDRMRALIRLLREAGLPELQELSGTKAEPARRILCDHALEVLGAHFRGERLPALPPQVQKMLDVEDEALNIHAGGAPKKTAPAAPAVPAAAAPAAESEVESTPVRARPGGRRKTRAAQEGGGTAKSGGKSAKSKDATATDEDGDEVDSAFWND
ncbi:hypothetical protein ACFO4E_17875 [Nocardiopsis mangrovi]|uniref:Uncharacterized protein n=1 Tax=Nocardiopsis mangrovi TaxID=1179818 RepID=A0ABV9E0P5_9ACTN